MRPSATTPTTEPPRAACRRARRSIHRWSELSARCRRRLEIHTESCDSCNGELVRTRFLLDHLAAAGEAYKELRYSGPRPAWPPEAPSRRPGWGWRPVLAGLAIVALATALVWLRGGHGGGEPALQRTPPRAAASPSPTAFRAPSAALSAIGEQARRLGRGVSSHRPAGMSFPSPRLPSSGPWPSPPARPGVRRPGGSLPASGDRG